MDNFKAKVTFENESTFLKVNVELFGSAQNISPDNFNEKGDFEKHDVHIFCEKMDGYFDKSYLQVFQKCLHLKVLNDNPFK